MPLKKKPKKLKKTSPQRAKKKAAPKSSGKLKSAPKKKAGPKVAPNHKKVAPKKESLFERLLREKQVRLAKIQEAKAGQPHHFGYQQSREPLAHLKFSKFAGPRRRAA